MWQKSVPVCEQQVSPPETQDVDAVKCTLALCAIHCLAVFALVALGSCVVSQLCMCTDTVHMCAVLGSCVLVLYSLLGPYWNPAGTVLGPCWDRTGALRDRTGTLLGSYWDPTGTLLEPYWDPAGTLLLCWHLDSVCWWGGGARCHIQSAGRPIQRSAKPS
jgi:hypothetical protein